MICLLGITAVVKTIQVNRPDFITESEKSYFPTGAVKWINEQDKPLNLFNDYNWGGYLIFHLPDYPVFVDGRTDLFGDEILNDYLAVIHADNNWEDIISKYDLNALLVPVDTYLARSAKRAGWAELFKDDVAVILMRE